MIITGGPGDLYHLLPVFSFIHAILWHSFGVVLLVITFFACASWKSFRYNSVWLSELIEFTRVSTRIYPWFAIKCPWGSVFRFGLELGSRVSISAVLYIWRNVTFLASTSVLGHPYSINPYSINPYSIHTQSILNPYSIHTRLEVFM